MKITKELLQANGWDIDTEEIDGHCYDYRAEIYHPSGFYADWKFGRTTLRIWPDTHKGDQVDYNCDYYLRVCDTTEKLAMAFKIAEIDYELKTEQDA